MSQEGWTIRARGAGRACSPLFSVRWTRDVPSGCAHGVHLIARPHLIIDCSFGLLPRCLFAGTHWSGGGGVFGTRPWWLALLARGGAYWPLALEHSAIASRHPYYCGHPH